MSRSLSWIDSERLAAALARVGVGGQAVDAVRRPMFGGHGRSQQPVPVTERSGQFPLVGERRNPFSSERYREFMPPAGNLQSRLQAFVSWVLEISGCARIFVVDEDGLVLTERNADVTLVAISSSFMSHLRRVQSCFDSGTLDSIAIDVDPDHVLHLLQVRTTLGAFCLGFVVRGPVKRKFLRGFQAGLVRAMEEP